ncbi:MAG: glutamate racemase [Agathobacter sp.]|nr:glutamate racemase [Agathobacter sp.]
MKYSLQSGGPIAVFDSGVGGISVLRELARLMPGEDYLYYGDSKHAPYGVKDTETVRTLTCGHARWLFDQGAKGLVVACNTATSAAVRTLREQYPYIPIVGIEPAVKPAAKSGEHPRVLVMATPMTIREEKFRRLVALYEKEADIFPLPCPGLMDFVERGDLDGEDLHKYLTELLYDYRDNAVDAVVLGCTHYPFARRQIGSVLGSHVRIFDGGEGTAREMQRRLAAAGLLRTEDRQGHVVFENSDGNDDKLALCRKLLMLDY